MKNLYLPILFSSLLVLLAVSCETSDQLESFSLNEEVNLEELKVSGTEKAPISSNVDSGPILGLTVDANGNTVIPTIVPPDTPLYYRRTGLPVLAPDGHQITAGEYIAVNGTAEAKCLKPGTQVKIHLRGLIPNALYRTWILTFKEPGFNPTLPDPFVNLTGSGSLGPNDCSRNSFRASASGQGTIVRFIKEGALSEFGFAEDCMLTDIFEWHVIGALQQPGQPSGPEVGPPVAFPNSAVEQFVFVFRQ